MKMGRPKTVIDWDKFEFACKLIATKEEICGLLNTSDATLQRHIKEKYDDTFEGVLKRFSATSKLSLRRSQFKLAERSATMSIWLGKQYLGQREPDLTINDMPEIPEFTGKSDKELDATIEKLQKKNGNGNGNGNH